MQTHYARGVLLCLVATVSWGTMFPIMTGALERIDPFTFTALRYTIAGAAFLILLVLREGVGALRLGGERVLLAWFLGSCGFAGFGFLVFLGQQMAGPQGALTASIMMATMPMLGLLVNWLVRKARPPVYSFGFIALSFAGVTMVITNGDLASLLLSPQSYLAGIPLGLGALCWVTYTVGGSLFPHWSPYRYTAITTALGMISVYAVNLILVASGTIALPGLQTVVDVAPHLAYLALVAGLLAVPCWNMGNKILTPMNGVLFMDVVPLTAFAVSAASGVVPQPAQLVGATITAAALILNNLCQRNALRAAASAQILARQGSAAE
ncbi:MAG TPA: DMT family transporter [Magnetospirillum sp.]|nr:DMT family transporter [Magnetospirillum sp.]